MVYVARSKANTAGLCEYLLEHYKTDLHVWQATHLSGAAFPRQQILDDLQAGRTVNVPSHSLPRPVLETSAPWRPGPPRMGGPQKGTPGRIYPERAIVSPDGAISFTDEDAVRLWLEEMGEWL